MILICCHDRNGRSFGDAGIPKVDGDTQMVKYFFSQGLHLFECDSLRNRDGDDVTPAVLALEHDVGVTVFVNGILDTWQYLDVEIHGIFKRGWRYIDSGRR